MVHSLSFNYTKETIVGYNRFFYRLVITLKYLPMILRKIRESEVNLLTELYLHYTHQDNLPPLTQEKIQDIWRQIGANPCINYFVSEVETTIAASCILTITPSFIRGGDGYGFIEHVVTHANYRRRGVGQAIVKFALDYAWENGCTEVMLLSGSQNERAHNMYEKLGFDKNRKKGFIIYRSE